MFDKELFYERVQKELFLEGISEEQVGWLELILTEWEKRELDDLRWLAFIIASVFYTGAEPSIPYIFDSMINGRYTGKKLYDYFSETKNDWEKARKIKRHIGSEVIELAKQLYSILIAIPPPNFK